MGKEQSSIRERQHTNLREPHKYKVIIHNDDFTPMDFVVMVLMNIFYKSREDAVSIMLQVHNSGKGVAGVYSFDIAVTKAGKATESARNAGHPLVFTVEPEN